MFFCVFITLTHQELLTYWPGADAQQVDDVHVSLDVLHHLHLLDKVDHLGVGVALLEHLHRHHSRPLDMVTRHKLTTAGLPRLCTSLEAKMIIIKSVMILDKSNNISALFTLEYRASMSCCVRILSQPSRMFLLPTLCQTPEDRGETPSRCPRGIHIPTHRHMIQDQFWIFPSSPSRFLKKFFDNCFETESVSPNLRNIELVIETYIRLLLFHHNLFGPRGDRLGIFNCKLSILLFIAS